MTWKWSEWRDRLQINFACSFHIADWLRSAADESSICLDATASLATKVSSDDTSSGTTDTELNLKEKDLKFANKLGIIKDCFGAFPEYQDYQLRPNFAIALAVVSGHCPIRLRA